MKVLIQKRLLEDLEDSIYKNGKLDLDFAVYFTSLSNSLPSQNRNNEVCNQIDVKIDSQRIKKIKWNYYDYIKFLIGNDFIEKSRNHFAQGSICSSYRIKPSYYQDDLIEFLIRDKKLLNKFDKNGRDKEKQKRMEYCKSARPHLISFFNENLKMDCDSAMKEIQLFKNDSYEKYKHGRQILMEWKYQSWSYSISNESDNRLHSLLTRTNSSLRKHITYKDEQLVFLDLKTSQPFFFCALLRGLYHKDMDYLKRIGTTQNLDENFLIKLSNVIDRNEVIAFVKTVVNEESDYYEELAKIIPIQYSEKGKPVWGKWNKEENKTILKEFDSPRDCMKEFNMLLFNCKSDYNTKEIKAFAENYPTVFKVLNMIKKEKKKDAHKVLSHIEAHCLLDVAAKNITSTFSQIPLLSIHDCLVTTKNKATSIKKKMEDELFDLVKIKPTIKLEY